MNLIKNVSGKDFSGGGIRKKHKKIWIVLAVVLIVIIGFVTIKNNVSKKQREMMAAMHQTETASIEKRTLMSTISATGSIVSSESKDISVSLSNIKVETVNYKVGDMINEGDILCTFDSEDIEKSLSQAKASLNVTTAKSQMDIASSERSLSEAVENSNIEQSRIDADTASALNDYNESVEDTADAKSAYENAQKTTSSYKEQLNTATAKLSALEKEKQSYITTFENARDSIVKAIDNSNGEITLNDSNFSTIEIETDSSLTPTDIYKVLPLDPETPPDTASIDTALESMKEARDKYKAKDWLSEKEGLSSKVNSAQQAYESALKTEESLKSAYEQASSAEDNKYDAYVKSNRSKEDTARNNASTIANKTDNVNTSKLNAATIGNNDKNQVESYNEQLENCTVKSPISGMITALNIENGDIYSGNVIATIEDISSYKITTEIDEYDIVDVKPGQKVVIKTNGTGDLELDGTVESVAPRATTASGGNSSEVTYTVTITVDTPCEDLKLDMTAKLSIILESRENVFTVPYNAVMEDSNGDFYIEVQKDISSTTTQDNKPPKRISITKGIESDYYIEVISDEIKEGMQVIVPQTEDNQSIPIMMMRQGPMGGF